MLAQSTMSAHAVMSSAPTTGGTPALRERLVQRIGGQPTEQLGVKIGGLLRHHLTGEGYVAYLRHRTWIHQKCNIGRATAHLIQCLGSVAQVRKILLVAN